MAKVRDQHLGTIQGRVGPQVFKVLNSQSYVAQLPHRSQTVATEAVMNQRKRFSLTVKFMKAIYSLVSLKYFWSKFTPEFTSKKIQTSAKITRANYPNVTATEITDLALLVPDFGFSVEISSSEINLGHVRVDIDAIGNTGIIDTEVEKFIFMACVMHLSNPVSNTYPANRFFSLVSDNVTLSISEPLRFDILLDDSKSEIFKAYDTKKTFIVLITTDTKNDPVHFSSTYHLT